MRIKVKEAIIVEGKYDKQKLSELVDAVIIETTGFDIFKNEEMKAYISDTAKNQGLVILTDSDRAGFKIRNYIKSFVDEKYIKHAYIPEVKGKEKRKSKSSAEGLLGVEGISHEEIIKALKLSGCVVDDVSKPDYGEITKLMLYNDGFIGRENSHIHREKLCRYLNIPVKLSTNSLISVLNSRVSVDEYEEIKHLLENKRNHEQNGD